MTKINPISLNNNNCLSPQSQDSQTRKALFDYSSNDNYYQIEKTTNQVPTRKCNPNDKRPDVDDNEWKWINEQYDNIKEGSLEQGYNKVTFIAYEDTEDGLEEIKITIQKKYNGTSKIIKERLLTGTEFVYLEVDNTSGKILSKQTKTGDYMSKKRIYNEDGTTKIDKFASMTSEMLNRITVIEGIDY